MSAFGTAADTCLACGHVGYSPTGVCADESACVARWDAAQDCPAHPGTDHASYDNRDRFQKETAVLCEARCESGKGPGTCPTCGAVYR